MQKFEIIDKVMFCILLIAIPLLSGCQQITQLPDEPPRPFRGANDAQHYNTIPVVSYRFDPRTNLGELSVDIKNRGIEVRRSVINHIGEICSSHNVLLEAGKNPPKGAHYGILEESVNNGILTIKFKASY